MLAGMIFSGLWKGLCKQSSGAVRKSRWPSWAFRPNEPYGFRGRKATMFTHWSQLVPISQPTSEDIKQHNSSSSLSEQECLELTFELSQRSYRRGTDGDQNPRHGRTQGTVRSTETASDTDHTEAILVTRIS